MKSAVQHVITWINRGLASALPSRAHFTVPIISISNQMIFPGAVQLLHAPEPETEQALQRLSEDKNPVALSFTAGTIAVLGEIIEVGCENNVVTLAAEGRERVAIIGTHHQKPFSIATVKVLPDIWKGKMISRERAKERLLCLLDRWTFLQGNNELHLLDPVKRLSPERICDVFGFYGVKDTQQKKEILESIDAEQRFQLVEKFLVTEINRLENFLSISHFPTHGQLLH